MSVVLLPRLDRIAVDAILGDPTELMNPIRGKLQSEALPAGICYAASGGSPASTEELLEFREAVLAIGHECGFPGLGNTRQRAEFDELAAILLAEHPLFQSGEALRDDAWAFVATILLPDVATWRFAVTASERFHGGVRNTFQRLWMRGRTLDRGRGHESRWGLLALLSEDGLVQVTERPAIGADARLSLAFAEGWVRASSRLGRERMEDVTRAAVIRVRLRNQVQLLAALDDEQLSGIMDDLFGASRAGVAAKPGWVRRVLGGA